MFKFLRRVFIILVLLIIVFFIFRIIKPEATNRFVDKVKNIPTTISSRFHREKDPEIIINWKSNKETKTETKNDTEDKKTDTTPETNNDDNKKDKNNWDINDLERLEDLNKEIESIIQDTKTWTKWEDTSTTEKTNESNTNNEKNNKTDVTIQEVNTSTWTTEQPKDQEEKDQTTTTNTSNILTQEQRWNCAKAGLSVKDCEDLVRDLSHYN